MLLYKAYNKINLGLEVLEKLPSGYHYIQSFFFPITLYDEIKISFLWKEEEFWIHLEHELPEEYLTYISVYYPENWEKNILYKVFFFLREEATKRGYLSPQGVHIWVKKKVPSPSGTGSSSALGGVLAHAFSYILRKKNPDKPYFRIPQEHFLSIGADLPFFLRYPPLPAYVEHIGEVGYRFYPFPPMQGVLIFPPISISTREAYKNLLLPQKKKKRYLFSLPKKKEPTYIENPFLEHALKYPLFQEIWEEILRILKKFPDKELYFSLTG